MAAERETEARKEADKVACDAWTKLPWRSDWACCFAHSPAVSAFLERVVGSACESSFLLFQACSAFTRVTARTLALSPNRDTLIEGFSHFVTSMTAPIASGWSVCWVGLARKALPLHRGRSLRTLKTHATLRFAPPCASR